MPKESSYFDSLFRPPNLSLEIGTGVTVAPADPIVPVANTHRKSDGTSLFCFSFNFSNNPLNSKSLVFLLAELLSNCLYEEHEYEHGQVLPNRAVCKVCTCFYGEIVCSDQKCPPLKIGCKRVHDHGDECCSKILCGKREARSNVEKNSQPNLIDPKFAVKGEESPTVVLDRSNSSLKVRHEPTVSPDPFRDVIRTEPAPDLPSLIGDMMITRQLDQQQQKPTSNATPSSVSVSTQQTTVADSENPKTTESTSTTSGSHATSTTTTTEDDSIFSLDSVFDLFFSESSPSPTTLDENASTTATSVVSSTTTTSTIKPTTITLKSSTSSSGNDKSSATPTTKTTRGSVGILKLAGCNIYGRMYHVGRIITELSSPCLECTCTELGVQCKPSAC